MKRKEKRSPRTKEKRKGKRKKFFEKRMSKILAPLKEHLPEPILQKQ